LKPTCPARTKLTILPRAVTIRSQQFEQQDSPETFVQLSDTMLLRKRSSYEALLNQEEHEVSFSVHNQQLLRRSKWTAFLVVTTVSLVVAFASSFSSSSIDAVANAAKNPTTIMDEALFSTTVGKHTIPTFLSVVDHESREYVVALENPLYDRLKAASLVPLLEHIDEKVAQLPKLFTDRTKIGVRDSLTLRWTAGKDMAGNSILNEDGVIALYCGDWHSIRRTIDGDRQEHEQLLNENKFLDVATIAQARATHQTHNNRPHATLPQHQQQEDLNQWHFPSFPVLRHEVCQFSLYQAMPDNTYAFLRNSEVFEIELSRTVPTGIHLALGNSPNEMVVQFVTGEDKEGKPVAQYSKQSGGDEKKNIQKASGTSHTYTVEQMCEEPANITEAGKFQPPGVIHVIRLTELEPNTVYEYKVGLAHGQGITWSSSYSFTAAPAVGDATPFSYLVYGDQGCPSNGWGGTY